MDRVSAYVLSGLHEGLGQRRMCMRRPGDRLAGRLELERSAGISNQLRRARPDDVDAEELVVFLVGYELHEAARVGQNAGLGVGGEGKLADLHVVAAFL